MSAGFRFQLVELRVRKKLGNVKGSVARFSMGNKFRGKEKRNHFSAKRVMISRLL